MKDPEHNVMRSRVETNMDGSKIAQMKFSLWIKKVPVALIVFHNRVTHFTRVSLSPKHTIIVKNMKLMNRELWPIKLVCSIGQYVVKVEVRYSPKRKKFLVKINNTRFYDLAYRASTFDPNAPRPDFDGSIYVNGIKIIRGVVPWFVEAM